MDAIKWIEKDLARLKKKSGLKQAVILFLILVVPMALGLGLRRDWVGVFDLSVLIPNLIAAFGIVLAFRLAYERNFSHSQALKMGGALLFFCVLLASGRVFFPEGARTTYPTSETYWHQNLACFLAGGTTTLIMGVFLSSVAFLTASFPNRRFRFFLSILAGVSGMVMLGFHCDSSSPGHVFFSHFGQGVVIGFLIFIAQEVFVKIRLHQAFPELMKKIKNPTRLG